MKRLMIVLVLVIIAGVGFSQDELYSDLPDNDKEKTAAYHLKQAGTFFQISGGLAVAGGLTGAYSALGDMDVKQSETLLIVTGVAGAGSLITYLVGTEQLKLAGEKMSVGAAKSGVGIVWKF